MYEKSDWMSGCKKVSYDAVLKNKAWQTQLSLVDCKCAVSLLTVRGLISINKHAQLFEHCLLEIVFCKSQFVLKEM